MGSGTIVSALDDGQYRLSVDYGSDRVNARVALIDARITQRTSEISDMAALIATVEADYAVLNAAIDTAISNLKAAITSGGDVAAATAAVNEAVQDAIGLARELGLLNNKKRELEAEKRQFELSKAALLELDVEQELTVWCADYTTGKSGEVATIEVPGEPATTLIAPGGRAPTEADGEVVNRLVQDANQAFFNAAILPGWQKFLPTYRFGTITSVNVTADTCSVGLDATESSAQSLGINQSTDLADVPVEYMSCNATAFTVGDRVLVAFENQDWASPKVIGFESNPSPCGLITATGYYQAKTFNASPFNPYHLIYGYMVEQPVIDALMGNTGAVEVYINGNQLSTFYDYTTWVEYEWSAGLGTQTYSKFQVVPGDTTCGNDRVGILCVDGATAVTLVVVVNGSTRVNATFTPSSIWPDFFPTVVAGDAQQCLFAEGPAIAGQTMVVTRGGVDLQPDATWMAYPE